MEIHGLLCRKRKKIFFWKQKSSYRFCFTPNYLTGIKKKKKKLFDPLYNMLNFYFNVKFENRAIREKLIHSFFENKIDKLEDFHQI
jgi:hypothetical protein